MPYYLIEIMTNKQTKQTEKTMKNTIKGYNVNKFIEDEHVFIQKKGTFFFDKETAENNFDKRNQVGCFFDIILHDGVELYRMLSCNVWN